MVCVYMGGGRVGGDGTVCGGVMEGWEVIVVCVEW